MGLTTLRLDADGARGGPEPFVAHVEVTGRFDLFDAWANHTNLRATLESTDKFSETWV